VCLHTYSTHQNAQQRKAGTEETETLKKTTDEFQTPLTGRSIIGGGSGMSS
jgi:hypothetical protein